MEQSLPRLADGIGLTLSSVKRARWATLRWPKEHRRPDVSWTTHRVLAANEDEGEQFEVIAAPRPVVRVELLADEPGQTGAFLFGGSFQHDQVIRDICHVHGF